MKVSLRFEAFKRDRFQCGYCGRTPPDVLLEVDHVVPKSAGGEDVLENLLTACWDCNRGKGAKQLEEGRPPAVDEVAVAQMRERVEQAKAYMAAAAEYEEVVYAQLEILWQTWCDTFGGGVRDGRYTCDTYFPYETSFRRLLKELPLADLLDAIRITGRRFGPRPGSTCSRYFFGVVNRMLAERRGGA